MLNKPFLVRLLTSPLLQIPQGTNQFFEWYFYGLSGLGGWLFFLLLALAAAIWMLYDSQKRRLPATGWRLGVILLTLLLLPTILYRFTVTPVHFQIYQFLQIFPADCPIDILAQTFPEITAGDCDQLRRSLPPLTPFGEIVFYLGLLGGILAPVLAVGYFITFQGMQGCIRGHMFEKALGQCPQCAAIDRRSEPDDYRRRDDEIKREPPPPPRRPEKPKVQYAWLMNLSDSRRYDLCQGTTRIGRAGENDIMMTDPAVSRLHAQIRESHGHFTISDLDSASGTFLNGKRLRTPQVLQSGDEITLGDSVFKFFSGK